MARHAAWTIEEQQAENVSQPSGPKRVARSEIELERHLEDWIANDVALIAEDLTLVGRQVAIDDGRLDLLAIDSRDRWVVIEIKPGALDSGALAQALGYAASIARLSDDDLRDKLEDRLGELGDAKKLSERMGQQLKGEQGQERREIAILLVGAGIDSGLERMNQFLGRFNIPINIVSFDVFQLDGGPKLLVREIVDESTTPRPARRQWTLDAIRREAVDAGVGKQLDRFVNMAKNVGLAIQPQKASVRIAPMANRTRFLMYAKPRAGGGQLGIWVGPSGFSEFFPHVSEEDVIDAIGRYEDGAFLAGSALDSRLEQIERFLADKVQRPDALQSC